MKCLKITTIDPVNDIRWDEFVEKHPFGWLCHLSAWKQTLEESFTHMKGHYLVILNNNAIEAALPLFEVRSWLIGNKLVSIPYGTLCDPLISTKNQMEALLEASIDLARQREIPKIEIRAMAACSLIEDKLLAVSSNYKHHYLALKEDPEELKRTFDRTCVRQRISRASKSNLTLKQGSNESDLQDFYRLYLMTRKEKGLPPQPYKFFKLLWDKFSPSKRVTLHLAEYQAQPIAGLLLFKFKNRVSAEASVADNNFRGLSPNHLLFWEAIKSSYGEGFEVFDFGRTSADNAGLMDFKKRWGTKIIDLPYYYYPKNLPLKEGEVKQSRNYKIMNNICRNSPDFALKLIGNFIYHHV
jgi:lipid II:glycine glycyltransferase (peptidoglycan interpeptide bridge formation enzyme)